MPRTHLVILAIGILLTLLAGLAEGPADPPPPEITAPDAQLGAPDLRMEGAEITQFDAAGELDYRIVADAITHYPQAGHTLLDAPRITLYGAGSAPWEMRAAQGTLIGAGSFLDSRATRSPPRDAVEETVVLDEDVHVRRQRGDAGFVELTTSHLELFPGREYARTDRPVIIDADSGRTTASGLRADLATGLLQLESSATERVRTTLFPDRLR
ncbi:MAG TPA: LPS export ABC transporter periplasmic protein LptC [Pseudomonadales bacterium]|nr:LPS export ABC transporter periplasmic protein LptC [Pseudomonadales bacterium]